MLFLKYLFRHENIESIIKAIFLCWTEKSFIPHNDRNVKLRVQAFVSYIPLLEIKKLATRYVYTR